MIITDFQEKTGRLTAARRGETVRLDPWGTDSVRVRITKNSAFTESDGGLLPSEEEARSTWDEEAKIYRNGRIAVSVDEELRLSFLRDGKVFLEEYKNPYAPGIFVAARDYAPKGGNDYAVTVRFAPREGERLYGMGQHQQPHLELSGTVLDLTPRNGQVAIPFCVSDRGYGFLWNNPSVGRVSFGKNVTEWHSERCEEIDYFITVGDTPKELLWNYTAVTGRAPHFPEELLGLWQCRLRYRSQEEVLNIAREYQKRGLPLSMIVIDYYHWCYDGDWDFDPAFWPDPEGMVKELDAMGTRCMVSVWPTVDRGCRNYGEFKEKGLLTRVEGGEEGGIFGRPFYDATNPEAGRLLWREVKRSYYDRGIDTFWLDCGEPEYQPPDFSHYRYAAGPAEKTAWLYPLSHLRTFWEGQKAAGQKDVCNLARSAWIGAQRYGAIVWSGDIRSNFETLRVQLAAGLNAGLAGIPWWTTDTAGFFGSVEDPLYNELLIRWFQFSTFSPVLRLHGYLGPYETEPRLSEDPHSSGYAYSGQPHELWSHGEEVYEILKKYLLLRLSLKDYLREIFDEASQNGSPLMRTLFYEFPEDERAWQVEDEYMLGGEYLVAPVLYAGMRERDVYLPRGRWENIHTNEVLEGGKTHRVAAPLDVIPVFRRLAK